MKIKFEDIKSKQGNRSFWAFGFKTQHLPFNLHYHPEYELTYIAAGKGERMVGDTLGSFVEGDLVLLGSNLPHTWIGKDADYEAFVIQFAPKFINSFLQWSEFQKIESLLARASGGLFFSANDIGEKIKNIIQLADFQQVIELLKILNELAYAPCQSLSLSPFVPLNHKTEARINTVCNYVEDHYKQDIALIELADLVYMSVSAFCKFFKKTTGKTFSEYLNFIRIQAVSRDLQKTDKTIAQIAFANGFESLSYFNRVFKNEKGISPQAFRKLNS
ncbi:MAG: AraC family transcriptional regulator [Microscillaceae bacterium]|jgi:AraC-like DNA-binding protein|nr:AraC family transcriptional regulator [Microscillaceae bacterium]